MHLGKETKAVIITPPDGDAIPLHAPIIIIIIINPYLITEGYIKISKRRRRARMSRSLDRCVLPFPFVRCACNNKERHIPIHLKRMRKMRQQSFMAQSCAITVVIVVVVVHIPLCLRLKLRTCKRNKKQQQNVYCFLTDW